MRDDNLDKVFTSIRKQVYRLQGKCHHIALLGMRVTERQTKASVRDF